MALRGWRLIGVAGTIFAYVAGILFLSLVSIQSPQQRRLRGVGGGNGGVGRSFSEIDPLRNRELGLLGRRQPLQWCRELRYIDSDHPFKGWPIGTQQQKSQHNYPHLNPNTIEKNKILQTFPGHYVNKQDSYMLRGSNSIAIRSSSSSSTSISLNNNNNKKIDDNRPKAIDLQTTTTTTTTSIKNNNINYLNNNYNNNEIKINYEPIWPQIKHRSSSLAWRSQDNKLGKTNELNKMAGHWEGDKKTTSTPVNIRDNAGSKQKAGNRGGTVNGLTALASFPGSGNTWLRYLLQQATGILTGSVYKDYGLLKSGFPAENVCNKSVLIIKTHEWGPNAWAPFTKAILLIRDPDKAILAEFNRQSGGHVGFASPDRYKRTKGRYWQQFVTNKLWAWEQMNLAWAKNFTGEIKIIFYDDLVGDVETVLRAILQFINFTIDEDLLTCALQRREGIYRRKRRIMTFNPYSPAMHKVMNDKRDEVYAALGRINP